MSIEIRAEGIMRRNQRSLRHFPGAGVIAERLVIERPDRAQIDDVRRQLMIDAVFDVGADLHVLGVTGDANLRI